jgi:CPA2 family monovalent cation:H+ antiporter-2
MNHIPHLITDLGLILGAAAIVTILFKWLKQPLVLGYLIAGFIVGPNLHLTPSIAEIQNIKVWAEIGVIFLLFGLGLEFSFKKLMKVGAPASITALIEVSGMVFYGYVFGKLLGWSHIDSIFLGGILGISSTTIIMRAFDEAGVKGKQFAGLVFGILVMEDLLAIVLMVLLTTLSISSNFSGTDMLFSVAKLIFFLVLWFILGIFFVPTLLRWSKKLLNDEMLLITSLALCILMVWLASIVGFSPALGAFIMGSILAETVYAEKIEHLLKPVKDLFGAVFFVSVGMLFNPSIVVEYAWLIAILIVIIILGKIINVTIGALVSGQPLKISIQAGFSLAQIGEFSFIIASLGLTLKVTSDFLYPIAIAVSAITTFTTPYLLKLAEPFYNWLVKALPPSWVKAMNRYSNRSQKQNNVSKWQEYVRSWMINSLLISILITSIVILSSYYLLPFTRTKLGDNTWATLVGTIGTFIFMSPFLWTLITPHKKDKLKELSCQPSL